MPAAPANPACEVCHGTGHDPAFGGDCTECWGHLPTPRIGSPSGDRWAQARRYGPGGRSPGSVWRTVQARYGSDGQAVPTDPVADEWKRYPRWTRVEGRYAVCVPKGYRLDSTGRAPRQGDTVLVRKADGTESPVVLDVDYDVDRWGNALFWPQRQAPVSGTPTVGPGLYRGDDGRIYRVQPNRDRTHHYAKALDPATGRFEYAEGALRRLRPEHALTLEEAQAYGKATGVCACCGRTLTDPDSVAAGIGPICASRHF